MNGPTRRRALGLLAGAFVLPRFAWGQGTQGLSGVAFGTEWSLVAAQGRDLAPLRPAIEALFARIDEKLSPWRKDSVISAFNDPQGQGRTRDPAMVTVATSALEIARRSEGAFDPTVGPLVARWGFGPIADGGPPDWRGIRIGQGAVTKTRADLTLDLCGIAKGWALDLVADLVEDAGHSDFLFDLGGELTAKGTHPSGRDWRVAVDPVDAVSSPAILRLPAGAAVATSGTGEQGYVLNGTLYSHVINPAVRHPMQGTLRSVSVVATDAMTADGWATALLAAGDMRGPEIAQVQDMAALFVFADGRVLPTRNMHQFII